MDYAGASVVTLAALAARAGVREIITAGRRDFAVYGLAGKTGFIGKASYEA